MRRIIRRERIEHEKDIAKDKRHVEFLSNDSKSPDETRDDEFIATISTRMSFSSTS